MDTTAAPSLFKTTPFRHQLEELERSRDLPRRAVFWEMGCGKSKITIDTAAHLYREGKIDGVLILAPNGVHQNWVTDELPTHMPVDYWAHAYSTKSSAAKWHKQACIAVTEYRQGLPILAMSYDAFMTYEGRRTAERFLAQRQCLYVLDESQRIKTPGAKRTISVVASGRRAEYKRILTGTPITKNPFDVYAQLKFLDETFWREHGFASYEAFKTYFGVWEERVVQGPNGGTGRFSQVVAFKNLDRLNQIVAGISSRVTKEEVLDLPPKVYQKRYFNLSPEQSKAYTTLRDEYIFLLQSGEPVTAILAVTRLLRLQQIACGYLPGEEEMHRFPDNPRLTALREILEDVEGPAIIFARFRPDVDQICALLGDEAVRYDGAVGESDRLAARRDFQAGRIRYFVGNPAAAGVGLTLTRGATVIYYSNSFDLEHRLQSEDRAHRIGQDRTVTIIDLIAQGTVDEKIVKALREKLDIATTVTGDSLKEWI